MTIYRLITPLVATAVLAMEYNGYSRWYYSCRACQLDENRRICPEETLTARTAQWEEAKRSTEKTRMTNRLKQTVGRRSRASRIKSKTENYPKKLGRKKRLDLKENALDLDTRSTVHGIAVEAKEMLLSLQSEKKRRAEMQRNYDLAYRTRQLEKRNESLSEGCVKTDRL